MMMLSEIATALNARMLGDDVVVKSVGSDSRSIVPEQLFVAIKGEHFDGNQYAAESIAQGAAAAMISDVDAKAKPAVLVEDTRLSLGELARYWRSQFAFPVIAVTGSNGKTTVKEMIASILQAAGAEVVATHGNLNNDIGMPLTLLRMQENHTHAVIEMGMNHLGEIRYLTQIAAPNIALITNAGTAHIGELGSREAIAEAKGEIFEGLSESGIAIINSGDRFADYWRSLNQGRQCITFGMDVDADVTASYQGGATVQIHTPVGVVSTQLNALGKHNLSNALAAVAVAVALNIPTESIAKGLRAFSGVSGRLQSLQASYGGVVIDDTYNANPDSMKAALDVLVSMKVSEQKSAVFVMGDMAELGNTSQRMHAEIGTYAREIGVDQLYTVGTDSRYASEAFGQTAKHFDTKQMLIATLQAKANQKNCVLVKGSRSMKMEDVVTALVGSEQVKGVH